MPVFTLAAKDLRLLLRDPRSAVILLLMPLVLTLVLGLALGEGFGEKADDRLRVSVVRLDGGLPAKAGRSFPAKPWSELVLDDLAADPDGTGGGIRVEVIGTREEADRLVARGKRAAVLVFEPHFSDRMDRASFLAAPGFEPVNPLGRDGVVLDRVGLTVLRDPTQPTAAAVIEQVAQVTLFRVVIPYMIGQAFARVGDDRFMEHLADGLKDKKPLPAAVLTQLNPTVQKLLEALLADKKFEEMMQKEFGAFPARVIKGQMPQFRRLVEKAFQDPEIAGRVGKDVSIGEVMTPAVRPRWGGG